MQVRLNTRKVALPSNGGQELTQRFRQAFSRLASRVASCHVTLKDINGPRGGRDKVCMLRAELTDGDEIIVVDRSADMQRAIDRCVKRCKATIARKLERRRVRRRQRAAIPEPSLA